MKRSVGVLGVLGLVYAVALPAASAKVLHQDDFSTDKLLKDTGTYVQGRGLVIRNDETVPPFMVRDGVLTSSPEGSTSGSDEVTIENPDLPGIRYLLLLGDPTWTDVAIQTKVTVDNQGTGVFGLVLRAAPKTKPEDADTWYEFRYTTGSVPLLPTEDESGIAAAEVLPNLRILKVVKGKYTILAETDADRASSPIPTIMNGGDNQETGAIFRFSAKGNRLEGSIALPGGSFTTFLTATDDELKAGRVGLVHHDYNPVFDDLLIEDVP